MIKASYCFIKLALVEDMIMCSLLSIKVKDFKFTVYCCPRPLKFKMTTSSLWGCVMTIFGYQLDYIWN